MIIMQRITEKQLLHCGINLTSSSHLVHRNDGSDVSSRYDSRGTASIPAPSEETNGGKKRSAKSL